MPKTTFTTHDNGGSPFRVKFINANNAEIYCLVKHKDGGYDPPTYKPIMSLTFEKAFLGKKPKFDGSDRYSFEKGNSILFHINDSTYIYVGHAILKFNTRNNEKILEYYSPIGNSDVPYPFAIGEKNTYFMLEPGPGPGFVSNDKLDFSKNLYGQIYGHLGGKEIPPTKIRSQILHKRLW